MALGHYARQARKHWKASSKRASALDSDCSEERELRRQVEAKCQTLQDRVKSLEQAEARLAKWEHRKPVSIVLAGG